MHRQIENIGEKHPRLLSLRYIIMSENGSVDGSVVLSDIEYEEINDAAILGVSYWIALGRDEEDATEMVKFQGKLGHYTDALEYFGDQGWAINNVESQSMYFEIGPGNYDGTFVRGEDIVLCPHWHSFCHALRLYPEFVGGIELCDINNLTKAVIDGLGPALKATSELNFEYCVPSDLHQIAQYLEQNSSLISMRLHCDDECGGLGDLDAAKHFFDVLKELPSLRKFSFSPCLARIRPELVTIIMERMKDLEHIDFCWLRCPAEGHRIAEVISANPKVQHLLAGCSSFNGDDAIDFAKALASNTNLKFFHVCMDGDEIMDGESTQVKNKAGAEALLKAVYDPSSLNAILDCNHTCTLKYEGMNDLHKELNDLFTANWTRARIIKYKLLEALGAHSKEGLEVERLNDISLELMPRVLQLYQADRDQRICLTSTFRTFRDCVAPLLSPRSQEYVNHLKRKSYR